MNLRRKLLFALRHNVRKPFKVDPKQTPTLDLIDQGRGTGDEIASIRQEGKQRTDRHRAVDHAHRPEIDADQKGSAEQQIFREPDPNIEQA